MSGFPAISGAELIKILEKKGYQQIRTRGSHVRLYPPSFMVNAKKVTVPLHKRIKLGTFSRIIKDAGLSADDLKGK